MSYELHVSAAVAGQQQLEQLTRATESQSNSSKKLNEALYGVKGATDALTLAQVKHQTELAKVEQWTLRYKTAQLDATQATDRQTQAITRLGNAHGTAITQVQATSGALRVLENAMPIRAAEKFLTLIPGIGTALQAAFPIVGAVAFAEILINRIGPAVEKLADKWIPVIRAEKEAKQIIDDTTKSIGQMGKELEELRLANIGRTQGSGAELRARALAGESDVAGLSSLAAAYRARIAEAQQRAGGTAGLVQTGIAGLFGLRPSGMSADAAAATEELRGLKAALKEVTTALEVAKERAAGNRADAVIADQTAAGREESRELSLNRRMRGRALEADVREWNSIQKAKEKAAHELATLFDHSMPRLPDDSREARELVRGMSFGRDTLGQILGPIEAPAPPGPSITSQRQALRMRSARVLRGIGSDDPEARFQARLQIAQQEYDLDQKDAIAKHNLQAQEDALNALIEKRYDATMEREDAIYQMIQKQKQAFEQGVVGLVGAARQGRAGDWFKGQLDKIGDQILAKIAGTIFDKIGGHGQQTVSIRDALGTAAKDATVDNTTATKDNTDALRENTAALRGGGGGGSAAGGGFANYGFPTAGGTGGGMPGIGGGSGLSKALGIGAGAAGVGLGISDIIHGGAKNDVAGAGKIAAGAGAIIAAVAPALAIAGPIGMVAGLGLGLISSFLGRGPQQRQSDISHRLQTSQLMAPVSISAVMGTNGGLADFDRYGNVRSSDLSPFPTVQQGYFDYRHNQVIPGRVVSSFGGPGGGPVIGTLAISAIDTKNILDRHADIGDAVARSLNLGSSPHLGETLTARGR